MPDIEIEKEDKFSSLSSDDRDEFAHLISDLWEQYHKKRQKQIDTGKVLKRLISLNQADRNSIDKWKSNIKENKLFATWDSMKASLWKEIWSNEGQMFDVVGVTKDYEDVAEEQKEAIVYALKMMNAGLQFDLGTENWGIYGDFIYKTDWKTRKKKVKRFDQFAGMREVELPIEDNANVEAINPIFFNFDVTKYKYGDKESWDRCPKIFKRFETLESLKQNPLYTITDEQEQALNVSDTTKSTEIKDDSELATMDRYGDQYEVLYFQGDIKFNGKMYQNVVAEVLAGQFLIYFDENPIYINPFVWDCTQLDPETGRGISPLKCILDMCLGKEDLINKAGDIAHLNALPPVWASDDFLKEKYKGKGVPYAPGKVLEYEQQFAGQMPQQVKFDASGIGDLVSLLANDISDASSINANAMGNVEQGERKATDLQLAKAGGDTRTALKLDKIYQINLKVVENVAELLAMFKTEPELLLIKEKGKRIEVEITNAIRQGQYHYIYEDRNALLDRRSKFQECYTMLTGAANNDELASKIDWEETLKTGLEMIGFDNPEKFFKDPSAVDEVADMIKQMPDEIQMGIMQQIQPMLQQAMVMMQGQGGDNGINKATA